MRRRFHSALGTQHSALLSARKIMVRATNWVGDAVMSLPALRHLRRALPEVEIVLVARSWVAGLYAHQEVADRILIADPRRGREADDLRRERFEAALLLPNSFATAWVAWRAGIPVRCGYARDGRGFLLTDPVPVPRPDEIPPHQAYYYLALLRRLGLLADLSEALPSLESVSLRPPPNAECGMRNAESKTISAAPSTQHSALPLSALSTQHSALQKGRERLQAAGLHGAGTVVGLIPGAAYGTAKRWLPARYVALGRRLRSELGAEVVLFGSESERPLAERIASEIGPGAVSTAGRTSLEEFLEIAPGCDLLVTNDTGAMHVAAAAGVLVLALFGSTDALATRPLGPRVRLLKKPVPCSPCLLRDCPVDHRCMREISVEEVFEAACQTLTGGQARPAVQKT